MNTVFIRIVAAATINFGPARVRLLFEGGSYSRAVLINLGPGAAKAHARKCNNVGVRARVHTYIYIKRGYYSRPALISLSTLQVRLLFEGGYYSGCSYYSNKYGKR